MHEVIDLKVIDLSMHIKSLETPIFPGHPQPMKASVTTLEKDGYNANIWVIDEHTATHVDAPIHFVADGKAIHEVSLDRYVGWATVVDVSNLPPRHVISREELHSLLKNGGITASETPMLLFYTGYSSKAGTPEWFDHPGLSEDACNLIVESGFKAIGVDAPSPDREPFPAHKTLLPKNVAIIENLVNLEELIGKKFLFVAAPLKLVNGTGSPVRALAIII